MNGGSSVWVFVVLAGAAFVGGCDFVFSGNPDDDYGDGIPCDGNRRIGCQMPGECGKGQVCDMSTDGCWASECACTPGGWNCDNDCLPGLCV
ncbi:MAG: hypothetical protein FWD57_03985, partial [Polyangiaceae bacterium]|nr:hypothetical protein [Polyangiaceae bacterium]